MNPDSSTVVYKGNPYTGYPMAIVWVMLLPMALLTLLAAKALHPIAIFSGSVLALVVWAVIRTLYYYETDRHTLYVRRYFRSKICAAYPYGEITGLRFVRVKMAIHIEVTTRGGYSKIYPSGTLSKATLLQLQQNLEKNGVLVTLPIDRSQ